MSNVTVCAAVLVDEQAPITIHELARFCDQQIEWVVTLVDHGVLQSLKQPEQPELWVFTSPAVARARQVARLQREFDVNLDAAALIADLMQEIGQLRAELSNR
jgi:chaperone modulatory protein CbpM